VDYMSLHGSMISIAAGMYRSGAGTLATGITNPQQLNYFELTAGIPRLT